MHIDAYDWILFDADDTLFEFDAYRGLVQMFAHFGLVFSLADFAAYQQVNQALWRQYQRGEISATELQQRRFLPYAPALGVTPEMLNHAFLTAMAEICQPLPGALSLLDRLFGKVKLGLITNGFTALQQARLARTGLQQHFAVVIISEEVGVAKPHPQIFAHALTQMGSPLPARVLMVGDNVEADIGGGLQAGLQTCWLRSVEPVAAPSILPHFQVSSLLELETRLFTRP